MIGFLPIIAYLLVIMGFWLLLMWMFIKLEFKGSFEWIFTRIANLFRHHDKSQKADMDRILNPFGRE